MSRMSMIIRALLPALLLAAANTCPAAGALPDDAAFRTMLQSSFQDKGGVTVASILQQDAVQKLCSRPRSEVPAAEAERVQAEQAAQVVYPADGKYLGDWREGEKIAQNGRGLQFSDDPKEPNGGNCYACHQLNPKEAAYGTLGPSLTGYGRLRGTSPEILKYTWTRIYNTQAINVCSMMPRFGHQRILTEQQLRDVMALLLDPASPVNQ
ncbi:MAG: sulfur oxidation c-type cytochrome SoxX [Pseudomonadota bacterium]|nr:sulfur oxidation c-type cytochrome SoxX [Pseudomonadota bacterium]